MKNHRCADANGVILEMINYGRRKLREIMFEALNMFVADRTLIPKMGEPKFPTNHRPITILSITRKIFSRMLHWRLQKKFEREQCSEQWSFRPGMRIEDAIDTVETIISAISEYNLDLWIISLELKKAFDRLEHFVLFDPLREQGLDESEIAVLLDLYCAQRGCVKKSREFCIIRGMKQADALSSLLFNTALESVFRKWKITITGYG